MFWKSTHLFAACILLLPSFAQSATVVPLTTGTDWSEFRFDIGLGGGEWRDTNDIPKGGAPGVVSFSVNLRSAAYLQVTDAFLSGDIFEVFSNGKSLGHTSSPVRSLVDDYIGDDYSAAVTNASYSSGQWLLEAGTHTITGFVTSQPQMRGRAALRVVDVSAVPLPGGMVLLLGAGAALGAARRRKSKARGANS
ncbi:hypothetical protein DL239_14980 [Sedimentitalea sp. CY04]|uniref:Secreted protein n=1 Tax=Parasedimentitalea denitrificans TaxID=2211118 RepID=A0ABX0WC84_9RHOB|nr:hypothetical protein [Sedimentitalea sp. CY04]NIZ62277.1 hypothetical protein [Sedimentitalea sp. CY04]